MKQKAGQPIGISKGHLTIPSENLFKDVLLGEKLSKSKYVFKALYEVTKPKIEELST